MEIVLKDESGTKLKPCPACGDTEFLVIDSSYHAECSWVECECGHHFQSKCREENIGRYWNKHCKEVTSNDAAKGRAACGTSSD